jgi:hypothetical protein
MESVQESADRITEGHKLFPIVRGEKTETRAKLDAGLEITMGSNRDTYVVDVCPGRPATVSFRDIGWNGNGGASQLTRETVDF